MSRQSQTRALVALAFALVLALASPALAAQKKPKKKKEVPRGTPVLWRAQEVERLDLFHGPGGRAMRPDLRRVTFIKEEKGGWSKKYRVKDGRGRVWVAKLGRESQSETAATRLVWAAGYMTEITYLAPSVNIRGKGTFKNVRFEARPENIKRAGEWTWKQNPFVGTRELQGLKVLMVLLNNWDVKDANNVILVAPGGELRYAISDLGATLGKTGSGPLWRLRRSRNDPDDFAKDEFLDGVKDDGRVDFSFDGKMEGIFEDITVEQARWIGSVLARLDDRQLNDAFRAANYTPAEIRTLTGAVRSRINQLNGLRSRVGARD